MDGRPVHRGSPTHWDWDQARRICLAEARGVLGQGAHAEDAAQEAVLRAWRQRKSCRSPGNPRPWLRRIARNEALRYGARRVEPSLELTVHPTVDGGAEAVIDCAAIRDLVERLAAVDRRLLFLQYWADVPVKDIAARLQMPEGTVKIRLHRARAVLRQMIEDEP